MILHEAKASNIAIEMNLHFLSFSFDGYMLIQAFIILPSQVGSMLPFSLIEGPHLHSFFFSFFLFAF